MTYEQLEERIVQGYMDKFGLCKDRKHFPCAAEVRYLRQSLRKVAKFVESNQPSV